jgi:glycosyltransferase involved in cell wall biosynthesis
MAQPARFTRRKPRAKIPEPPGGTKWPAGSIIYICGENPVRFGPKDKELGGSETAVVELCKRWAATGRPVAVYGNVKEGKVDGVSYRDIRGLVLADTFDTVIFWRSYGVRFFPVVEARRKIIDLHDSWDPKNYVSPGLLAEKADKIMVKSKYHKGLYDYFPADKVKIVMNGVKMDVFEKIAEDLDESKREPHRLIYASSYERGLEPLLEHTWPAIRRAIPDAEFHIYYGLNRLAKTPLGTKLKKLFKQPGVHEHGRVSHEEIAKEKCRSAIHLYVSNSATEIDCISVRESLLCGAVPVLGKDYVFKERDGVHVTGSTDEPQTYRRAASTVIRLLKDQERLGDIREKLRHSKTIVGWDEVAAEWLKAF